MIEIRSGITTIAVEKRSGGSGGTVLRGVAIRYNSPSNDLGGGRRAVREIILPGAVAEPLAQRQDTLGLVNHDCNQLLARVSNGSLILNSDSTGLRFEMRLLDTQLARDVVSCVRAGLLNGMSFGFQVSKDSWSKNSAGEMVREIRAIKSLSDVSVVAVPAYDATTVHCERSLEMQQMADRLRILEKTYPRC